MSYAREMWDNLSSVTDDLITLVYRWSQSVLRFPLLSFYQLPGRDVFYCLGSMVTLAMSINGVGYSVKLYTPVAVALDNKKAQDG